MIAAFMSPHLTLIARTNLLDLPYEQGNVSLVLPRCWREGERERKPDPYDSYDMALNCVIGIETWMKMDSSGAGMRSWRSVSTSA